LHRILVEILDKDYVNLSQSDVVRFLYYQNLLPSKSQMHMIGGISYIAHMSKEILVVEETENVVQAYLMLSSTFQTAAAVVNEEGVLVSTLSSTDLRNLTLELLGEMRQMSVRKFLLHTKNEKDYRSPVCLVTEESTLIEIVRQIVEFRVHRVWIVDNEQKPFGVISLSDIFRVLARYNKKLDLLDKLEPKIDLHKVNKKFEEKDEEENLEKKIETKNSEFEEKMIENTYNLGDEDYYLYRRDDFFDKDGVVNETFRAWELEHPQLAKRFKTNVQPKKRSVNSGQGGNNARKKRMLRRDSVGAILADRRNQSF